MPRYPEGYWTRPWTCKKCGSSRSWVSVRKGGKRAGQKERHCLECSNAQSSKWRRKIGNKLWNAIIKNNRRRYTFATIQKYGGKCECCGERNPSFLQIDHINGGGTKERGKDGGAFTSKLYWQPIREDLRVLCANCNFAMGRKGFCPHTSFQRLVGEAS